MNDMIQSKQSTLNKLNKTQLLNIIKKMKKEELIHIIENKIGGGDIKIIQETNNSIRKPLEYNKYKNDKKNNSISDDVLYNKIYTKNNI